MNKHVITGRKNPLTKPVLILTQNDRETTSVSIRFDRYADDVDLSYFGWYIRYANAANEGDVFFSGIPDADHIDDTEIRIDWTVPECMAAALGTASFSAYCVDTDGRRWGTGIFYVQVIAGVNADYEYTPEGAGVLDNFIASVSAHISRIDALDVDQEQRIAYLEQYKADRTILDGSVMVRGYIEGTTWKTRADALSVLIPVAPKTEIKVLGTSEGNDSRIAILKNVVLPISANDTVEYSSDQDCNDVVVVRKNGEFAGHAPDDAQYLYCYFGIETSSYSRKPQSLCIGEYDYCNPNVIETINRNQIITDETKADKVYIREKVADSPMTVDCAGYISGTDGTWVDANTNRYHSLIIPVNGGELLTVYGNYINNSPVRGLTDFVFPPHDGYVAPVTSDPAWSDGIFVDKEQVYNAIVPDDVRYLFFYCGTYTGNTRKPSGILINGIDCYKNIEKSIVSNKNINPNAWHHIFVPNIKSLSHGGYHTVAPWNSLEGFKLAKQKGFSWIETDVQFTADNIPVLCHDNYINNYARNVDGSVISETVYIYESTYQDLLQYDFGIIKGSKYRGMKISTFEDALRLARGIGLGIRLELKKNTIPTPAQIDHLFNMAEKYGMLKNMEWCTNQHDTLSYIAKRYPDANLVVITSTINAVQILADTLAYAKTLESGRNRVILATNADIVDRYAKVIVDHGYVIDIVVSSLQDVLAASSYITSYTSNSIVVEEELRKYNLGDDEKQTVTAEDIRQALGFTPANSETVNQQSETISALQNDKQNTIPDLETIREGARKGATALQTAPVTSVNGQTGDVVVQGGGAISDRWELIETIVLDADTDVISRSAEPDGNPYRLKDFRLILNANGESFAEKQAWLNVGRETGDGFYLSIEGLTTYTNSQLTVISVIDDKGYHSYSQENGRYLPYNALVGESGYYTYTRAAIHTVMHSPIVSFRLYNQTFRAGQIISIYGVRA